MTCTESLRISVNNPHIRTLDLIVSTILAAALLSETQYAAHNFILSPPLPLSWPCIVINLFACAALFLYLVLTDHFPSWNPVPVDFVLLEDDFSKQKPVARRIRTASVRRQ